MHVHEKQIQEVAQLWTDRLATGRGIKPEQREAFRGEIVARLRALHPTFLRAATVGGDRPCVVLKAALAAGRLHPMVLRLGVRTRIAQDRVMLVEAGLVRQVSGERIPAYLRPMRVGGGLTW